MGWGRGAIKATVQSDKSSEGEYTNMDLNPIWIHTGLNSYQLLTSV